MGRSGVERGAPGGADVASFQLALIPADYLFGLDPRSLLRAKAAGIRIEADVEELLWCRLCEAELGLPRASLSLSGPGPEVAAALAQDGPRPRCCRWRRVLYDLDVSGTRNELRHGPAAYEFFPAFYAQADVDGPEDVEVWTDAAGRHVHCRFTGHLGGDRCVVAKHPLPSVLSATALPRARKRGDGEQASDWEVAYRPGGYYEVSIGSAPPGVRQCPPPGFSPTVSVGLCTARLDRTSIATNQAGWVADSWALHGDDGELFHGSMRGSTFAWISPEDARNGRSAWHGWEEGMPRLHFGEGDTVGCGLVHLLPEAGDRGGGGGGCKPTSAAAAPTDGLGRPGGPSDPAALRESVRGIYYTLNGEFTGIAWLLSEVPPELPLFPCVGIDAHWQLTFNFGQEPFRFDVDAAFPPVQVVLASAFSTLDDWSQPDGCTGSEEATQRCLRPLVSKLAAAPLLGGWAARPAELAVDEFRTSREDEREVIFWSDAPESDGDSDSESELWTRPSFP